jgi:hypothetical protein
VLIIDVLGNYNNPEFRQYSDLRKLILDIKEFHLKEKNREIIPQKIFNLKTSDPTVAAEYLSAVVWEINGGTIILDEIDSVRMTDGSCFDEYIRYGRNHNGDLITGCRRPAELDRNITAAANKFYCFQTHEWRDIEYFSSQVFGERAEELQTMEPYTGLFLDYDARLVGKFKIDIKGRIYHTEVNCL